MARFLLLKFEPAPSPSGPPVHAEGKEDGGGKQPGGFSRSAPERSASARKAAATRKRNADHNAHQQAGSADDDLRKSGSIESIPFQ